VINDWRGEPMVGPTATGPLPLVRSERFRLPESGHAIALPRVVCADRSAEAIVREHPSAQGREVSLLRQMPAQQ